MKQPGIYKTRKSQHKLWVKDESRVILDEDLLVNMKEKSKQTFGEC